MLRDCSYKQHNRHWPISKSKSSVPREHFCSHVCSIETLYLRFHANLCEPQYSHQISSPNNISTFISISINYISTYISISINYNSTFISISINYISTCQIPMFQQVVRRGVAALENVAVVHLLGIVGTPCSRLLTGPSHW